MQIGIKLKTRQNLENLYATAKKVLKLHEGATTFVFGDGNPHAKLMIIGEAPGKDEDLNGRPFVGAAGKLLDEALEKTGIKRTEIFITNAVKSRPPKNRKPTRQEIASERDILLQEIALVQPMVICTLGATAYQALFLQNKSITVERTKNPHIFNNIAVITTIHPAYVKRKPSEKTTLLSDLQKAQALTVNKCG